MSDLTGKSFAEIFPKLLQDPGDGSIQKSDGTEGASGKANLTGGNTFSGVQDIPDGISFDGGVNVLDNNNIARTDVGNTFSGNQVIEIDNNQTFYAYKRLNNVSSRPNGVYILVGKLSESTRITGRILGIAAETVNARKNWIVDFNSLTDGSLVGENTINANASGLAIEFTDSLEYVDVFYDSEEYRAIKLSGTTSAFYPRIFMFTGSVESSTGFVPITVGADDALLGAETTFSGGRTTGEILGFDRRKVLGRTDFENGISFDGGANVLSDYEEGTWTPAYQTSNNDINVDGYGIDMANYWLINDLVIVEARFYTTSITSVGTGDLRITGLPFTSSNDAEEGPVNMGFAFRFNSNPPVSGVILNNSNNIRLISTAYTTSNSITKTQASDLDTGSAKNILSIRASYKKA